MSRLIAIIAGLLLLWALYEFSARPTETAFQVQPTEAVVANPTPYTTAFCKDETTITLSGDAPDDEARQSYPQEVRDLFRHWDIENHLELRPSTDPELRRLLDASIVALGQLDEGCITSTGDKLLVQGSIRSERATAALKDTFAKLNLLNTEVGYELKLPSLSGPALACQNAANQRVSRDDTVLFRFDSDVLHEIGRQLLGQVAEISKTCPEVTLLVTGHADAAGDKEHNIALGMRRAEAVVAYLTRIGVGANRLSAVNLGISQPIADDGTDAGRAANRRIEFRAVDNLD